MQAQDEEITLGTGRLLGLFFGLVVICALFFSLGFMLGRRASSSTMAAAGTTPAVTASGTKPSPTRAESAAKPDADAGSKSDELTFYKAVEQNEATAKLDPAPRVSRSPVTPVYREARTTETVRTTAPAGIMVQVAAVRKQDDAEALSRALRKKSYPVMTIAGSSDKLYHVQVGPFSDLKNAEATRAKLVSDGYNPIVKK